MDGWLSILVVSVSSWLPRRVTNQLDSMKSHGNGRLATPLMTFERHSIKVFQKRNCNEQFFTIIRFIYEKEN